MYETDKNFGDDGSDAWVDWLLSLFRAGSGALDQADKNTGLDEKPSGIVSLLRHYTHSGLSGEQWEQNQFNARQAEIAYQRQLDLFNMTQSIPAQVQQAKQAGINPASLYGNLSAGSVPSVSSASGSGLSSADLLSLITNFVMKGKELQIESALAESQAEKNRADARASDASANLSNTREIGEQLANDLFIATQDMRVDKFSEELNLLRNQNAESLYNQGILSHKVDQAEYEALITLLDYAYSSATLQDREDLAYWTSQSVKFDAKSKEVHLKYAEKEIKANINALNARAFFDVQSGKELAKKIEQFYSRVPSASFPEGAPGTSDFELLNHWQIQQLKKISERLGTTKDLEQAQKEYYEVLKNTFGAENAEYWANKLPEYLDLGAEVTKDILMYKAFSKAKGWRPIRMM